MEVQCVRVAGRTCVRWLVPFNNIEPEGGEKGASAIVFCWVGSVAIPMACGVSRGSVGRAELRK